MMKHFLSFLFLLGGITIFAQKDIPTTETFSITGLVEKEVSYSIADLSKLESKKLDDLLITNHLGEARNTAQGLKGVPIKEILNAVKFKSESPKVLSEFYLTFQASDGYKVVYSWNEIFNTAVGDAVYLITEKGGKDIAAMDDRILVLCMADFKTGRRNVKGLTKIIVNRVN